MQFEGQVKEAITRELVYHVKPLRPYRVSYTPLLGGGVTSSMSLQRAWHPQSRIFTILEAH